MGTKVRRPGSRPSHKSARRVPGATNPSLVETLSPPSGHRVFTEETWHDLERALKLSGRESEILKAIFDDQKESCIATNLGISAHTVHSHLERLYRKLRVSSRVTLVVRVLVEFVSNGQP
jgi:DNA-binding NarL/FixJ family response regulator